MSITKMYTFNSIMVLVLNITRMEQKLSFKDISDCVEMPERIVEDVMCGFRPLDANFFKRFCRAMKIDENKVGAAANYIKENFFDKKGFGEGFYHENDNLAQKLGDFEKFPHYKNYAHLYLRKHTESPFLDNFDKPMFHGYGHEMHLFSRSFSQNSHFNGDFKQPFNGVVTA